MKATSSHMTKGVEAAGTHRLERHVNTPGSLPIYLELRMRQVWCPAFNPTGGSTGAKEEQEGEAGLLPGSARCNPGRHPPGHSRGNDRDQLVEGHQILLTHLFVMHPAKRSAAFPIAAVTNSHNLRGLSNTYLLSYSARGQKPDMGAFRLKSGPRSILGALQESAFPCHLELPEAAPVPRLMAPPSSGGTDSFPPQVSLTLSLLLPSSTSKDLCDYIGLTWIIPDNLPILGPVY